MTTVDQILFGWAERDHEGNAGVRPVAHSGLRTIDRWAKRLEYVWAPQDGPGEQPEVTASLVHLVLDDEAAVLHKLPSRDPHGRGGATLTHVLVGDPRAIDARLALGLHDWPGWRDREPDGTAAQLAPLDLGDLEEAARPGLAALRERVAEVPAEQLTALVARVLAEPAEDFSVIIRPHLALPAMTALLDIAGPVSGRPWTFASRESTDKGGHQPRVVFLAARPPQSMYINQRRRVDVTETPEDTDTARFAAQLVELYLEAGHAALERIRPRHPLHTADDVHAWRRSVPIVDGRIADPRVRLDIFLDDDLLARAAARGALVHERARLTGELRKQPVDWLITAVRRWHRLQRRAGLHPELRELLLAEAVEVCLTGQGHQFDALVEATRDAEPAPPVVAGSFGRKVPPAGLDLSRAGHRRLLIVALALRMPADALDHADLLAASPADELLDLVERYAVHYPQAMHLVLRHLGDAGQSPVVARMWYEHGLSLEAVDRIARGDHVKEVECFRHLLLAAHGPRLDRETTAELVRQAGAQAPLGLYAAALELAADSAAEQPVRHELSEQFLRAEGYAGPGAGPAYGSRPGGPVLGRTGTGYGSPAARPASPTASAGSHQWERPAPTVAGAHHAHPAAASPSTAHHSPGAVPDSPRAVPDPAQWDSSAPQRQDWDRPAAQTGGGPQPPSADNHRWFGGMGQIDGVSVFFVSALLLVLLCAIGYVLLTSMP
ncbi:hypothetical protein ACWC0C_06190 [Streptomyces sp. NPDC001709]